MSQPSALHRRAQVCPEADGRAGVCPLPRPGLGSRPETCRSVGPTAGCRCARNLGLQPPERPPGGGPSRKAGAGRDRGWRVLRAGAQAAGPGLLTTVSHRPASAGHSSGFPRNSQSPGACCGAPGRAVRPWPAPRARVAAGGGLQRRWGQGRRPPEHLSPSTPTSCSTPAREDARERPQLLGAGLPHRRGEAGMPGRGVSGGPRWAP